MTPNAGARHARLLVAVDDPSVRGFLRILLETEGHRVAEASDGRTALRLAAKIAPSLITLDATIPGMDGFEVCRRLKSNPRTRSTPVVMVTAGTVSREIGSALSAGADDWIRMPFNPIEVVARVQGALERCDRAAGRNPLTGLPGHVAIKAELEKRLARGEGASLMHANVYLMQPFNDRYGAARGDEAIQLAAHILKSEVGSVPDAFLGHLRGGMFSVISSSAAGPTLATSAIEAFSSRVPSLYDDADARRGMIEVRDRRGISNYYPLLRLCIGATRNTGNSTSATMNHAAAEMSEIARLYHISQFAEDRRTLPSP